MTQKSERRGAAVQAANLPVAETAAPVRSAHGQQILATVSQELIERARESAARRVHDGAGGG